MSRIPEYIFLVLIFPGFLFSSVMGLLVGWVDRKVTARIQWRVGPPWYQNFVDVLKLLLYKETLIPENASKTVFLGMPIIAAAGASLVSTIILMVNGLPRISFMGDLIVIVYLLVIPSLALMLGAFASGNPYASLGASREMKLMLSYELPFLIALIVPIMKSGCAINLGDILPYNYNNGPIIGTLSGFLSFVVMVLCVQAKLGFIPFDMPEAETEIIGGPYVEYSGKPLAIFKLSKAIMTFAVPVFLMTLYLGGFKFGLNGFAKSALEYTGIVVIMILIKNTNPRVRIDQAVRFFWVPVTILAVLAILLTYFGY